MRFKGLVEKINNIVISDPAYKSGVWCRYENKNIKGNNWKAELELEEKEEIEISLLLKKNDNDCGFDGDEITYSSDIQLEKYRIGMDTACVALGINDKAKEIIKSRGEWQPPCALKTGTDGYFGEVLEGKRNDEVVFLMIFGYLDKEWFYSVSDIFDYLKTQFELKDLKIEKNVSVINSAELTKGAIVELNTCCIKNDVGGTKIIRNKSYDDPLDGMQLTVENFDGTISETTLHSDDGVVDKQIVAEILSGSYDYETGYNFKGKIIDNSLVEDFRKIGTTGYKPEDYKEYGNKLYEETKEKRKNYDPSIVYFSEFDISKVIELPVENDMEI